MDTTKLSNCCLISLKKQKSQKWPIYTYCVFAHNWHFSKWKMRDRRDHRLSIPADFEVRPPFDFQVDAANDDRK